MGGDVNGRVQRLGAKGDTGTERRRKSGGRGDPRLGQFFTPHWAAGWLWRVCRSYLGDGQDLRLVDPAAGEGILLQAAAEEDGERLQEIVGVEIDGGLVRSNRGRSPFLLQGDSLGGQPGGAGGFDAVLGNPPFGRVGIIAPQSDRASLERLFCLPGVIGGDWRRLPVEALFVERALQLVRPGGVVCLILPEGLVNNARQLKVRDWVLQRARLRAAIELPAPTFRGEGLNARTALVVLEKGRPGGRAPSCLMVQALGQSREAFAERSLEAVRRHVSGRGGRAVEGSQVLPAGRLRGARWDARYWEGRRHIERLRHRFPTAPLGDFISFMTYGPIVTGQSPDHAADGVPLIRQADLGDTGLEFSGVLRVEAGGVFDPPRSRVRRGDLLVPRSGAGTLGKNRLGVYWERGPANIACFVDLVRLEGLNPFYVWFFFKTEAGWRQIQSLINGVGTPNISFAEIRSLRLPLVPEALQTRLQRRYCRRVLPLLRAGERAGARRAFAGAVGDLETLLHG